MTELQRILHVDDDADIRTIVELSLCSIGGLTVQSCSSGREAVASALAFQPDLFLLDMMMPGMTGEETWTELRRLPGLEQVPVIFMTAKVQNEVSVTLKQLGALDVIAKPFDPVGLPTLLHAAWHRAATE
ncbi:response regulator [Aliiroseovarius sediminis]|uniref:response regulator n=1 Tax=Aliiroseovarius sediminis TaxID=2925839 RepID=UPI001F57ED86|nr:response regulator [Aliiroseovarius sediminis]MCI2395069.1 response regulator [Aliiroseovarius sediminis]